MILLAWAFTVYTIVYAPGGPVTDLTSGRVKTYVTQAKCERQRLREAAVTDPQSRPLLSVDAACVEVPD
jgi:hypothetical protein